MEQKAELMQTLALWLTMTDSEVADKYNVPLESVWNAVNTGKVKGRKDGAFYVVGRWSAEEYFGSGGGFSAAQKLEGGA